MKMDKCTVVVLGASDKKDRYSNKAVRLLVTKGYNVIPVHPRLKTIEGLTVFSQLERIDKEVHTLTVYVDPSRSTDLIGSILSSNPRRVILNPGAENPELEAALQTKQILYHKACTIVMLQTGQF